MNYMCSGNWCSLPPWIEFFNVSMDTRLFHSFSVSTQVEFPSSTRSKTQSVSKHSVAIKSFVRNYENWFNWSRHRIFHSSYLAPCVPFSSTLLFVRKDIVLKVFSLICLSLSNILHLRLVVFLARVPKKQFHTEHMPSFRFCGHFRE